VLWHLSLPVVLHQAFLFKFGDVNKAVSASFELEFWIFTLNIKMLPFGHVSSEFCYSSGCLPSYVTVAYRDFIINLMVVFFISWLINLLMLLECHVGELGFAGEANPLGMVFCSAISNFVQWVPHNVNKEPVSASLEGNLGDA
jgi:hypothetical protein